MKEAATLSFVEQQITRLIAWGAESSTRSWSYQTLYEAARGISHRQGSDCHGSHDRKQGVILQKIKTLITMLIKRKDYESLKRENYELKEKLNNAVIDNDHFKTRISTQSAHINMLKTEVENLKKWERKADPVTGKFIKQQ